MFPMDYQKSLSTRGGRQKSPVPQFPAAAGIN